MPENDDLMTLMGVSCSPERCNVSEVVETVHYLPTK